MVRQLYILFPPPSLLLNSPPPSPPDSAIRSATMPAPDNSKRTAIVTGSARGIGRAIAIRLAEDGYDVCVNDIAANEKGAQEVAQEIQKLGRKSAVAIGDVSKLSEVEKIIQHSVKELGDLNTM